jgi:hypothetical protein
MSDKDDIEFVPEGAPRRRAERIAAARAVLYASRTGRLSKFSVPAFGG